MVLASTAPNVYFGEQLSRMMFVANHIYILMAALANMTIGRYVTPVDGKIGKMLQSLGMALMMVGTGALIYAFTMEPRIGLMDRPRTWIGVVALAVLCHVLSGFRKPAGPAGGGSGARLYKSAVSR